MNDLISARSPRRHPMELQLTAMIDIFSMIVIFLILGAVFGASEMVIPEGIFLPKSVSKESVESAPRIIIGKQGVVSSLFNQMVTFREFREYENSAEIAKIMGSVKKFVQSQNKSGKPVLLNVIADSKMTYENIFPVIKVFQLSGFDALLFVAEGEGVKK